MPKNKPREEKKPIKNAQKDGVGKFEPEEITFIVQGELEYCDSINMFD